MMSTHELQDLINSLQNQKELSNGLMALLLICFYAKTNMEEFVLITQRGRKLIKGSLLTAISPVAKEHVLDTRYLQVLDTDLISEITYLLEGYADDYTKLTKELRLLIDGNHSKYGIPITPEPIRHLIKSLLSHYYDGRTFTLYDPTARTGDLAEILNANYTFLAEASPYAAQMAKLFFMINRTDENYEIEPVDTLYHTSLNQKQTVDCVACYPPSNRQLSHDRKEWPKNFLIDEPYFKNNLNPRSSEAVWIQLALNTTNDSGIIMMVVPDGFLSRSGYEQKLREYLVGKELVEGVILLPDNLYQGASNYSTSLLILNKTLGGRKEVKMLDARKLGTDRKKLRTFSEKDVISLTRHFFDSEEHSDLKSLYRKDVSFRKIQEADFTLKPTSYLKESIIVSEPSYQSALSEFEHIKTDWNKAFEKWEDSINKKPI